MSSEMDAQLLCRAREMRGWVNKEVMVPGCLLTKWSSSSLFLGLSELYVCAEKRIDF